MEYLISGGRGVENTAEKIILAALSLTKSMEFFLGTFGFGSRSHAPWKLALNLGILDPKPKVMGFRVSAEASDMEKVTIRAVRTPGTPRLSMPLGQNLE